MDVLSEQPVGLVIGTEDAYALDFWVWTYPERYLQLEAEGLAAEAAGPAEGLRLEGHR